MSADPPSWAEQNSTNGFVVACTVAEILLCIVSLLKGRIFTWDFKDQHKSFNWSSAWKAHQEKCLGFNH